MVMPGVCIVTMMQLQSQLLLVFAKFQKKVMLIEGDDQKNHHDNLERDHTDHDDG